MLYETLKQLTDFLNQSLKAGSNSVEPLLEWGNIAQLETLSQGANTLEDRIVLSLINLEEEKTLSNGRNFTENGPKTQYHNPPWHLNLYLLFSMRFEDYDKAIRNLSLLLQFFQRNQVLTNTTVPALPAGVDRLAFELITLNFEQFNQMWAVLGGKQYPFLLFKVRMVSIRQLPVEEAPLIRQIISNEDNVVNAS